MLQCEYSLMLAKGFVPLGSVLAKFSYYAPAPTGREH